MRSADGEWHHSNPVGYQLRTNGQRSGVAARLRLVSTTETVFDIGEYDRGKALVIDPVLAFSTYLGGSGHSAATSIALDSGGNVYIAGWTETLDLPGGSTTSASAGVTAYVAKLAPTGKPLYVTYMGGSSEDRGIGIAVDRFGSAVIAGWTNSSNFPTINAAQPASGGGRDGFVAKLNVAGNGLLFSTYLGGRGIDSLSAVAIDAEGGVYVTGVTTSDNIPVLNALQAQILGGEEIVVAKFSSTGARRFTTYLGGTQHDRATAIAVDATGAAYITGSTFSTNFPAANAVQSTSRGQQDVIVAKFGASGNVLLYSTYLGGSGGVLGSMESGNAIAVDASGYAYVAGTTASTNFPIVNASQSQLSGSQDAFAAKLTPAGNALVYSTFIGGSSIDIANAIAVDRDGRAHVGGYTASTDFPRENALQSTSGGDYDGFLVRINSSGNVMEMATYFGGAGSDSINGVAVDTAGNNVYVTGQTLSIDLPIAGTSVQLYKFAAAATFVTGFVTTTGGLRFVPVTPCRAVDTRNAIGPLGGPAITGGSSRHFPLMASGCGIPLNAQAYALNITAVPQGSLGYVTVWAAGQGQPGVSTLNSLDGRIKAAAAIVPAGSAGNISIYASDTAHVLVDVSGYFVAAASSGALAFYPVAPCRLVDTRNAIGALGGPSLAPNQSRTFPLRTGACAIPTTSQAYSLTFTAIPRGSLGFLTAWPAGGHRPLVSTLNALTGSITANAAIVPAGEGGAHSSAGHRSC